MFGFFFSSRRSDPHAALRAQLRQEKRRRSRASRAYRAEDTFWSRHRRDRRHPLCKQKTHRIFFD